MLEVLNRNCDVAPEVLINNMKVAIDEFVGGEDQFYDITMLAIRMN